MLTKIQQVVSVLKKMDVYEPMFPGLVAGDHIVYIPEWSDGPFLWGDLWVVQFGPLLLAYNHHHRLSLFLSAERAARYIAEV